MRYDTRSRYGSSFYAPFPNAVKWLVIANVAIFILGVLADMAKQPGIFALFGLTPNLVIHHFAVWQLVTYMFVHSTTDPFHILFNMLALWMFGSAIERTWGTRRFLKYYLICGVGAGLCVLAAGLASGEGNARTIGASGAIYGVLLAFGLLFPDTTVFLLFFPIKAKYLVLIMGALAFFFTIRPSGGAVSNVAHLGGLLVGYLYLRTQRIGVDLNQFGNAYKQWKLERAKRKFQVYMKKHDSNRGPWVN